MKRVVAASLALFAATAAAQGPADQDGLAPEFPRIVEIVFVGNEHTTARTMERELTVHVGDPADPEAIERSRQAVQDLALFRVVQAKVDPVPGGVKVRILVEEKYYLIPAPRADANSDGKYAYGAQLRWYNVFGLNHTLKLTWKKVNREEAGRGLGTQFDASYYAPFIFDTDYGLDLAYSHVTEPAAADPLTSYSDFDDIRDNARVVVTHAFHGDLPASQGWRVGGGFGYAREHAVGAAPPPSQGHAVSLIANAGYSDVRFNIYSEEGQQGGIEVASSWAGWASEYSMRTVVAGYNRSWYVGDTEHQSVGIFAEAGAFHGGPEHRLSSAYELGGAEDLRGYRHSLVSGDAYYYAGVEFLRPVLWRSVRGVAFLESGNAFGGGKDFTFNDAYNDAGLGLRIRFSRFVKFEANVGVAYALTDVPGESRLRFFFTGRR